jgi:16S rRNA (guanine966-N2)-methyltransferase
MVKKLKSRPTTQAPGQIRIIGGQWRGRKLAFPNGEGLRPTPDRVRETLFNWLTAAVPGARCLDLFAGSGALALEALSRGAAHVDLIESASPAANQLREQMRLLNTDNATVYLNQAQRWLNEFDCEQHAPYDIVFLDPPFRRDLIQTCVNLLVERNALTHNAWVYLEMGSDETPPNLPQRWNIHREKTAGQVSYRLIDTSD